MGIFDRKSGNKTQQLPRNKYYSSTQNVLILKAALEQVTHRFNEIISLNNPLVK